ncbi:hypothetical protein DUT91_19695 [Phyllobacterium salinisoli]|uniref:Uncharacterized protein n=1 Tax=Phyllobacterium salinisoli TaxID=1899321 RepID=A0A368JYQ6_9HYPH|nr:DUF6481 family protein [Phyllobacterium salinisoli]RCS22279.1 hypothetical protein DUT91_19695 [Phyllobacterium salinisoli]
MRHVTDNGFAERRKAAAEAKQQLLKKFETAPKPTDPEVVAKQEERKAIAAAREARRAEREQLKREERDRKLAEAEALANAAALEAKAKAEAQEAEMSNRIARVVADDAERKAERDRRYAARKARQR